MIIRIAHVINDSIVDGPGIRLAVFVQGCHHECVGCHNPQTHDINGGIELEVDDIIEKIIQNPLLDGITLSGGEPFLQPIPCSYLAERARSIGLNVWTYTGFTWEELIKSQNKWVKLLIENSDVIVDGKFEIDKRSLEIPFRGSANQRLIDVNKSLELGEVVVLEENI